MKLDADALRPVRGGVQLTDGPPGEAEGAGYDDALAPSEDGSPTLPPLYARWMDALLGEPVLGEPLSTCEQCAMAPGASRHRAIDLHFHATSKCCTFLPWLPNFLAGSVLIDPSPEMERGRRSIIDRIRASAQVSPLGLGQDPAYARRFRGKSGVFGVNRALICPHYVSEGGLCSIWRTRNAICSTFFCKHERGASGHRFWYQLGLLLQAIERYLAGWCVIETGTANPAVVRLFMEGQPPLPLSTHEASASLMVDHLRAASAPAEGGDHALWGEIEEQKIEHFERCARLTEALTWQEVERLIGPYLEPQVQAVFEARRALTNDEIPERLIARDPHLVRIADRSAVVYTYSGYDPREVPRVLLEALEEFDGRTLPEVARSLSRRGVAISDALVRRLIDHGYLAPVSDPEAS